MAYKYGQIEYYIKEKIESGIYKPDDKIKSESELTKKFGVSRQTVRTAIANLVNAGYLYTSQGKGTFVGSQNTVNYQPHLIGFTATRFSDYNLFPKIFTGVNNKSAVNGYSLLLKETFSTFEGEYECLKSFQRKNVDALVLDPCRSAMPTPNLELYRKFMDNGKPLIFYNGYRLDLDASYVIADDQNGGYLATSHLLDYGHKDIFTILKLDDMQGQGRMLGFVKAFRDRNLRIPEENVIFFTSEDWPYFWPGGEYISKPLEYRIVEKIRNCTALVAYNDYIAAKVIRLLWQHDIMFPKDFSIVSFDDTDLTLFSGVPMTSISHPGKDMGEALGEAVMEMLDDPSKIIKRVMPVNIEIRDSTQPFSNRKLVKI